MSIEISTNRLVVISAAFLTTFANVAFFRNIAGTYSGHPNAVLHLVALALVLMGLLTLFLLLFSHRRILKPVLIMLFVVSAATAYFMDTYNVVIDRDMLVNMVSTNAAESWDLLTPRFVMYIMLLGLAPAYLVWDIQFPPTKTGPAILARLKLASTALVIVVAVVLMFSSFFASFVREHKMLRYYANPLTPIYAVYKYGKAGIPAAPVQVMTIGTDARIPANDVSRELIIMVLGETARWDRFSLNGYERKTNPRLEKENVISFSEAQACGTSTAISVPCMFDREDSENSNSEKSASTENALDVLKHAGVNILWRDNNSDSKGVAIRVPFEDFRSPENNPICDVECRDEGMLAGLQEYIESQPEGDILIVLHQMGSHGPAYYKRYPDEFRVFVPTCDSSQLDSCSQEEISNSYDNTILYTDHFLAEVIELLRASDDDFETGMFYASDHGESLGENGVYLHGLPYWMAPDAQTAVPMIMWLGKNYHAVSVGALRKISDEAFTHDHVFHTLLGFFEIVSEEYDGTKDMLDIARRQAGIKREYDGTFAP
jgi:lipid A ethanolaminephosphotransferase